MPKKNIIIRVDGNTQIGLGHIYRGIALAEMLKDEFSIRFITQANTSTEPISDAGFKYNYLPKNLKTEDEPLWLKQNIDNNSIIICDGYQFKSSYQKQIKQQGFKLVYIDDLANWHMYADVVINHSPGAKKEDYTTETYTKLALGLDYALLRPAFLQAAKQKRKITKIDTAFVCFGGADPNNFTLLSAKALLEIEVIKKINIVIGGNYQHQEIVKLQKENTKINVYSNIAETEMLSIMQQSHLAIAPSSNILFEILAVKMPVLSGYYVENQKNIYDSLKRDNVIIPLGDISHINRNKLIKIINKNLSANYKLINAQEQLYSKDIKERYLELIDL